MFLKTKGIININKIFLDEYGYNDKSEILSQDFIEAELNGQREKFWFYLDGKKYMFKKQDDNTDDVYAELIAEEIANVLEFKCAKYKLAIFDNNLGVITEDFVSKDQKLVLGAELLSEVLNKNAINNITFLENYRIDGLKTKDIHNKLNNLEDIWSLIDLYLLEKDCKSEHTKNIMQGLIQKFFFDLLTLQGDSHVSNWGIIENSRDKNYEFAPLFDNSNMCGLNRKSTKKTFEGMIRSAKKSAKDKDKTQKTEEQLFNLLYHSKLLFSVGEQDIINIELKKRKNNLEILDYFLKVSSNEYIDFLEICIDKLEKVGIDKIMEAREKNDSIVIPEDIKCHIFNSITLNMIYIRERIEQYKIDKGGKGYA